MLFRSVVTMFNIVKPIFAHTNIYIWYPRWDSNPQNLTPQASAYTNSATRALILLLNTYIMHKVIYRNIRPNLAIDFFPISPAYKKLLNDEKAKGNLLEVRLRAEFKPDGRPYLRNVIEKGELLGKLIAVYA